MNCEKPKNYRNTGSNVAFWPIITWLIYSLSFYKHCVGPQGIQRDIRLLSSFKCAQLEYSTFPVAAAIFDIKRPIKAADQEKHPTALGFWQMC